MASTLTVIGLVTKLKSSTQTSHGEAVYREKLSDKNIIFGFKQFSNALHEYNEMLRRGPSVIRREIYNRYRWTEITCEYCFYVIIAL